MFGGCDCMSLAPPIPTAELLVVIKETENDDLTGVLEELIDTYPHQIGDVAVGLCQHLVIHSALCTTFCTLYHILHVIRVFILLQATAFNEIFEATQQNEEDSYKALTALGIMGAIQSLVKATINQPQVLVCVCVCVCVRVCGCVGVCVHA